MVQPPDRRDQFLIAMYSTMWENISRHILIVWQSVGVLVGAFAALILVEKHTVSPDYAATFVVLAGAWQVAHVFDASWWFNRNLLIVTNIERQFLTKADIKEIHYYFETHRDPKILDHHIIQLVFGLAVTAVVLAYHFVNRIYPIATSNEKFDAVRTMPYAAFLLCGLLLMAFYCRQHNMYWKLRNASPGKSIDSGNST